MTHRSTLGRSLALFQTLPLAAVLLVLGAKPSLAGTLGGAPAGGPDTFWLNFTHIALGLATLAGCLWVAWGIVLEMVFRWRSRRMAVAAGFHQHETAPIQAFPRGTPRE